MDKKVYLSRFSKLVRWRLPADEAEEVINDYTELLDSHPEEGTALVKTLGDPEVAVKLLGISREYMCWMAIFMSVCISMLYFVFTIWDCLSMDYLNRINGFFHLDSILFYFSLVLIAFWKWKTPKGKGQCPGLLHAALGLLIPAAMTTAVWGLFYYLLSNDYGITRAWIVPIDWTGPAATVILTLSGGASFAFGLLGMIRCRTKDRRWIIVAAMAITVLFLSMDMLLLVRSLTDQDAGLTAMRYMMPFVIAGMVEVIWTLC